MPSPIVVFDVNETLSDMAPLRSRFADVGAPEHLAATWFAAVLRDGFGLAAAGSSADFATIARGVLQALLTGEPGWVAAGGELHSSVDHILSGFEQLTVHPDVPAGVRNLRAGGARLITLSNGAATVAEQLLTRAGLRGEFERLLSVADAGRWKPAGASYRYAAEVCGVAPDQLLLVAVHPWDTDGAARADLRTAWVNRSGAAYPAYFRPPRYSVRSVPELAEQLKEAEWSP